jgi:orotate phosphoribosyltransferase
MKTIFLQGEKNLSLLARCGGYYECPWSAQGTRFGPLVGYAATYVGDDGVERAYVGDIYANFAKAERHGPVLSHLCQLIQHDLLDERAMPTGFCGAPEGGKALATVLSVLCQNQYIYPEKRVLQLKTPTSRELSELVFNRHEPEPNRGESWYIIEDVCNNFSTTRTLVELIESYGATVSGIVCFLNRSLNVEEFYELANGRRLPVRALVKRPIPQYRQDDPYVAEDVANGNVIWKPKLEWDKLPIYKPYN